MVPYDKKDAEDYLDFRLLFIKEHFTVSMYVSTALLLISLITCLFNKEKHMLARFLVFLICVAICVAIRLLERGFKHAIVYLTPLVFLVNVIGWLLLTTLYLVDEFEIEG